MKTLLFTALTSGGRAFDVNFPLHPQTRSAEAVSEMITALLETLSHQVEGRQNVSDGDVLQALAMTLAVRARMVDVDARSTLALINELVEAAHRAAQEATPYDAARA